MRILLDTNVLVRATKRATGPAREILRYFVCSRDHHLHHTDVRAWCEQHGGIRIMTDVELLKCLRESAPQK